MTTHQRQYFGHSFDYLISKINKKYDEQINKIKGRIPQIKNNTLVIYAGGCYDGCFWEYNYFIKNKEGKFKNIYSTGYYGFLKDEDFTRGDEFIFRELKTYHHRKPSPIFIDLDDVHEIIAFTSNPSNMHLKDLILKCGTMVNNYFRAEYKEHIIMFKCAQCGSIDPVMEDSYCYDSDENTLICQMCYDSHCCNECGNYFPGESLVFDVCENCACDYGKTI